MSHQEDVISALNSFIIFARYIGLVDFVVTGKPTTRNIEHSKRISKITTTVLTVIAVAYVVVCYISTTKSEYPTNFRFDVQTVTKCIFLSYFVVFVVNFLMHKFYAKEKLDVLKRLVRLEKIFWSMNIAMNYKPLKIRVAMLSYVYAIIIAIVFITYNIFSDVELSSLKMSIILLYYYLCVTEMIVSTSFCVEMYVIKDMFILLDLNMKKKILRSGKPYPRPHYLIQKTAQIHQDLCKLALLSNRILSVQIVFALACNFAMFTLYLYLSIQKTLSGTVNGRLIIGYGFAITMVTKSFLCVMAAHQCVAGVSYTYSTVFLFIS